ncbi:hypothetical protein QAD02_001514 [Eretmocerus hayati]|uniref:Uncharacterized protein n=1 Tax=Eretmocerus hayati TaxID=131215 RepID=A0ACC2NGB9_9HYME|nr:hypothetical protein QAD02_001514 [Eretmocerus hayati]
MASGTEQQPDKVPPDIYFKCHPTKAAGIVVCLLCEGVYHKSDFVKTLNSGKFITPVFVICNDHSECDLTSNEDARVVVANLTDKLAKYQTSYKQLENKYKEAGRMFNEMKSKYDVLLKSNSVNNSKSSNSGECVDVLKNEIASLKLENSKLDSENEHLSEKNDILMQLNTELKENNSLLKENNELMKLNMHPRSQEINTQDYAQVVAMKPKQSLVNVPDIIIELQGQDREKEESTKLIKKALSEKINCPINKLKEIKNKIYLKCRDPGDIKKVSDTLMKEENLKINIEIEKMKEPRINVVGVDPNVTDTDNDNIENDIRNRNNLVGKETVRIVHKYISKRTKKLNLIMEVSREAYMKIMTERMIYVGYNRCPVFDDFNIGMCYKCNKYGHGAKKCYNEYKCKYCAEDHNENDCQNKNTPKCSNCIETNEKWKLQKNTNHCADNKIMCDTYKFLLHRTIKKTNYPYTPTSVAESRK